METIIGLLIFLVPIIFKLIGKRLEQAAKVQQSADMDGTEPIQDWAQQLKEYMEMSSSREYMTPRPMSDDSIETPVQPKKTQQPKKVVPKKRPILMEEEKKPKEKIDVKKMIIYSEIMSPKYKEKVEY